MQWNSNAGLGGDVAYDLYEPARQSDTKEHTSSRWFPEINISDRPLHEAEWDKVRRFVRRINRTDLRLRFGRTLDLRDEVIMRRAFDIDGRSGMVAWLPDETADIAGISHQIMLPRSEAEVALLVRSDLKRIGIGEFLLRDIVMRSKAQGLKRLVGFIGRENRAMLCLAAKVGFEARGNWDSAAIKLTFDVDRTGI
jgi:acetyltransferase